MYESRQQFWLTLLAVAAGGAIGATLRFVFSTLVSSEAGQFPLATFAENVLGSAILGLLIGLIARSWNPGRYVQPFLCIGVLGSFTTFSNYSMEIVQLADAGRMNLGFVYAVLSIVAGLLAALLGLAAASWWAAQIEPEEPSP
jgi:CrcB protein